MQADTITLAVDVANDGTTVDYEFSRYEEHLNRSVYIGEQHNLSARDTLNLYRTQPKANGAYKGTAKSSAKFTLDKVVDGVDGVSQLTSPIIAEVSFSVPVGVTDADQVVIRQRLIALLDDDVIMGKLMNQLQV